MSNCRLLRRASLPRRETICPYERGVHVRNRARVHPYPLLNRAPRDIAKREALGARPGVVSSSGLTSPCPRYCTRSVTSTRTTPTGWRRARRSGRRTAPNFTRTKGPPSLTRGRSPAWRCSTSPAASSARASWPSRTPSASSASSAASSPCAPCTSSPPPPSGSSFTPPKHPAPRRTPRAPGGTAATPPAPPCSSPSCSTTSASWSSTRSSSATSSREPPRICGPSPTSTQGRDPTPGTTPTTTTTGTTTPTGSTRRRRRPPRRHRTRTTRTPPPRRCSRGRSRGRGDRAA